ncbi:hypothetical protein M2451_002578 [Dysgonomonas sp. PFB1-18]|uniref:hypothetical protein n=1 Tax=unclassified Dysgonomonas TaxID=2630389 RepID=UPI00247595F9|nr:MULTISPECIES: hypothetical protein [unclassified Dysgonomonas]MDH6308059.1 hypothetical protein [Dysgonomonas sp. PF1-14]MDH6339598.1 hypothetical protein [Dysgonomonas sp. PF1-16]MDH6381249.1 hypothetical protein [Dysgonomonas sp. PFB1-18]MDH6398461.1 hypothetical protein [Dysgonomonas sp. PF1-23]
MDCNRIVIDALKKAIEEWVSTGSMSADELNSAILAIEKHIDKAIVDNEEYSALELLKSDLMQIKRLAYAKSN